MVFKCQEDSFLQKFTTKVKSAEKFQNGFNVIFEDTILFPEGGGQPCDFGEVSKVGDDNKYRVSNVTRKGAEAIHFVEHPEAPPFVAGEEVTQIVNWERRRDHMQQHSGQHLITAVFEKEFKIITKSWWMGTESCYIEVDAPKDITPEQLKHAERVANEKIAAQVPVTITLHDASDPAMESVRSAKDVPDDVVGPLRVCDIEGLDRNLCCGTHVKNLAQLQVVKVLHVEKAKNKTLIHFLVGDRVTQRLAKCIEREQQLNLVLNGGPESHVDLVKKLQNSAKTNQKLLKNLAKELAMCEVEKFKKAQQKFYIIHRRDGIDSDFQSVFMKNVQAPDTLFFITLGDEKQGSILLQGPTDAVDALGSQICALLDGKGNGKNGKFQGKVNNFKKTAECDKLIKEYFQK